MKQHENNLNPAPFSISGFEMGSCCQAGLTAINRTPVMPAASGQNRLKPKLRDALSAFGCVTEDDIKREKLKCILKTYTGERGFLNTEITAVRVPECADATEFQRQRARSSNHPEKMGKITSNARKCGFTHRDREGGIYLRISVQMPCRTVKMHFGMIAIKHPDAQIPGQNTFRWRKSSRLKWRYPSIIKQEYSSEVGTEINKRFSKN